MCVMSMVHNEYQDRFRELIPPWASPGVAWPALPPSNPDLDRLERLIKEFKAAVKAAKFLDEVLKQPDCVDPEKEKLQARVKELEDLIATIRNTLK